MDEQSSFQECRDAVISAFVNHGEEAAKAYIRTIDDAELRDVARIHLAGFLAVAHLPGRALESVEEVEDKTEKLDALLSISRIFNEQHRLQEASKILDRIKALAVGISDEKDFGFLVAVELERLGLRQDAITTLTKAMFQASSVGDEKLAANAALWLARWGVDQLPEETLSKLASDTIKAHSQAQLAEIRSFASQRGRYSSIDSAQE